jgi:hypothetical protein
MEIIMKESDFHRNLKKIPKITFLNFDSIDILHNLQMIFQK